MAAPERIHLRQSPRAQNGPLQSSSVPSTPHQVPRDLRFSSRSPSPGRGISIHSPQSAVAGIPATRALPATSDICRFEKGAEFQRRRIPYKDGGQEPLPAPKTEPKKALDPHDEDKLTGDMRELYDRLLPSEESEDRRRRLIRKLEKILNDQWPDIDIRVHVFGSSGNLLSSNDSDVDICITTQLKGLETMHSLAAVLHRHGMERVVCRAAAKVPIVKCWDPELQLSCDMNVNNTLALENTRMIKTYVQVDDRVRPLAKIIKYWTKQRILNDASFGATISSYTWICMIINFLQCRKPPVLPSLQKLYEERGDHEASQGPHFEDDLAKLRGVGDANKESLGSLLFHFFRYYGYEFDYQAHVVSVKQGRLLSRLEKGWHVTNYENKEAQSRFCVEEPFNTNRNLGNSADEYASSGIHEEIRRAFDLVAAGKLQECCQEYVFPPEEKLDRPLFQRPAPKPKPILTRSASQSDRSHANSLGSKPSGRDLRNYRNNSSHRAPNNRRASSGAAFGNTRLGLMSPQIPINGMDYFGSPPAITNDQLHEQLYRQYQALQAQQEILRNQLLQQQQNHAQLQAAQASMQTNMSRSQTLPNVDYGAASPRHLQSMASLPSWRGAEYAPSSAPLLPGSLYHYPARYTAPASPLVQSSHDVSMTHPPSPSMASHSTTSRRAAIRGTAPDGATPPSTRSQSQPGRSFPSPATLQSIAHPGYDVSGAIGTPYLLRQPMQMYSYPSTFDLASPMSAGPPVAFDAVMPKEYVGYYLHHSPQLLPRNMGMPTPVPILRDITLPTRPTKQSPDRLANANGAKRRSRSPSPLSQESPSSTAQSTPLPQGPFSKYSSQQRHQVKLDEPTALNGVASQTGPTEPLIVCSTGSMPAEKTTPKAVSDPVATVAESALPVRANEGKNVQRRELGSVNEQGARQQQSHPQSGPSLQDVKASSTNDMPISGTNGNLPHSVWHTSPGVSSTARNRTPAALSLSQSKGKPEDAHTNPVTPGMPPSTLPLLSPVAELQSPPSIQGQNSPQREFAPLAKTIMVANGRHRDKPEGTNVNDAASPPPQSAKAIPAKPAAAAEPEGHSSIPKTQPANQWQQATRKHRKGKSQSGLTNSNVEAMPEKESERKGG